MPVIYNSDAKTSLLMLSKLLLQFFTLLICLLAVIPLRAETIDLQLRWHHQFQFAGYYAAKQQGYYQQAGLDVMIHEGTPDKIVINEVLNGHAQYGVANSELILNRLKGEPLVLLAAIFQHSPSVLLARKDAGIFSPSDLIGKKVMMLATDVDADFVAMFSNEHLDIKKMNVVSSSLDIQDLATGKVDAFNGYISNEPFFLKQQGVEFTVLNPRNYGVDFYSDMLFTSENELKEHPRRVKAFLNASLQGWQYAMAHPQEIITLLQTQYQSPKSKEHLEFEAEAMRSLILPDLVEIGHINPWRLQHIADTFVQAGMATDNGQLDNFIYNPDVVKEHTKRTLKILAVLAFFSSLMALVLYVAYQSMKRDNNQRKCLAKELHQRTDELALRNHILQIINQGIALPELLDELARQVESLHPEMLCSILILDDNNCLRHGAAHSLPEFYNLAVDGLAIGDGVGSCGTAAYRGERVIVENIQQHPFWTPYRELAQQAGVQSCWSQPIKNNHGKVLGTFAIYHAQPSIPSIIEIELIESYANLAQLGIERTLTDTALLASEQRMALCQQYGGIGTWETDLIHNKQIWSSTTCELLGFPALATPTWEDFLAVIYPEDRQAVIDATDAHIAGGALYDVEYRIIDANQQLRWMRSVGRVDAVNTSYFRGIVHDITDRKAAEEEIKQLAFYDYLTQLPNRRLLNERLQYGINLAQREGKQLAVLMLDLDRFKVVNDSFGHKAGDELLQKVALRIKEQLRKIDTVARLGGDEFVVLLPEIASYVDVERVALAVINVLSQPFQLLENNIANIGTSIGISFYPQHGDNPDILLERADSAMYQAKDQGRGCFYIV